MVRYINLESDKYYRNRDVSLVFRRLSGTHGEVTTEYIIGEFCQLWLIFYIFICVFYLIFDIINKWRLRWKF